MAGQYRELRNAVERAMLLAEGNTLHVAILQSLRPARQRWTTTCNCRRTGINLDVLERSLLVQAVERTGWNQTKAAALLGLNRDQIGYRVEKFNLERTTA